MWREKLLLRKTNKIQSLYPSVKFLIVCLYSFCSIVLGTIRPGGYPVFVIFWFLILPILTAASGVFNIFFRGFLKILFISALILTVQCFVIKSNDILWRMGFLRISKTGLVTGISLSFLVMNIAGIFLWMFKTTENKEIARALDASGMNHKITYVFMSSLQMIQVLGRNSRTIISAQQSRGVETEGSILVRARAFYPLLVPLILSSINAAEERALTLESKGFDVKGEKTYMFELYRSPYDKAAKVISLMVTFAVLTWRILAWVL
ncbi:MAG: energy-coupling factor transporter transmembrane protein EcfT [Spirochaetaceae bacterium]|jgi:energy-coupling factor transporter transmembrane protein EcfT|nr:energy-coupling factor transporter transmembrane protein EcfT [Spirochaetaceae bacterium]